MTIGRDLAELIIIPLGVPFDILAFVLGLVFIVPKLAKSNKY